MSYVNCGAYIAGRRAPSKKALKIALADAPDRVAFDPTSMFGSQGIIRGDAVPEGVSLQVVGPDPYAKRSWYATVKIAASGRNAGKVVLT